MKRFISFLFLSLFMFSTVGAFASVHQCEGEVTDISILSMAACAHEEVVKNEAEHCEMLCCDQEDNQHEEKDHHDNKDCCDTQELNQADSFVTSVVKADLEMVLVQLPTFVEFCLETTSEEQAVLTKYLPPLSSSDISLELQRFLI